MQTITSCRLRRVGWTTAAVGLVLEVGCASANRTAAWERQGAESARLRASEAAAVSTASNATALELWEQRDDKAKLLEAIAHWEASAKANPQEAEGRVHLSRAHYFLVDAFYNIEAPENLDELKLEHHTKGVDYGERALLLMDPAFDKAMREGADFIEAIGKIEAKAVPAAYWYCTNLGRFAVAKGLSAKLFYKDRIAAAMQRIRQVAPGFFYSAADRYLGAFYAALPGIAGKDLDKSAEHFRAATSKSPEYLGNRVVQSEFLAVELDDQAMYERLLREVLAAADGQDENVAPENRAAKRTAKKLLSEEAIEERF